MIAQLFYPKNNRQRKTWFLLHLGLGFLGLISNFFIILWIYIILINAISHINSANSIDVKHLRLINSLLYLTPFEIITRMESCAPFIPYELGKYLIFFLLLWGLSFTKNSNKTGYILIILLTPGIILGLFKALDYRLIVFNILGIINIGLGIAYFGGLYLDKTKFDINNGLRILSYSLFATVVYTILRTPDYEEIEFNLGANFSTSGGFGSNQVSTAFGLGMFICFYLWHQGISFSGFGRLLDLSLVGIFLLQGLLTFSRGGILGGVIAVILFSIWNQTSSSKFVNNDRIKKLDLGKIIFFSIPLIIFIILYANSVTKGNLLLRYQGESYGTLVGAKEKDLNHITSGRLDIFIEDLNIFKEFPFFGSGVSISSNLRVKSQGIAAHVELSRLLSEHGILGILVFLNIILSIISKYFEQRKRGMIILSILAIIGVFTTFHAATRTFLSPLLIAISFIPINSLRTRRLTTSYKQ